MKTAIIQILDLVKLLLIIRILLTWFPNIDWWKQPFKFLHEFSEPILSPFRRMIPPLGGFDLSPIFAFIFLDLMINVLIRIL